MSTTPVNNSRTSAVPRSVCVYCGSSNGTRPSFRVEAEALGAALATRGWQLVYGGADVGLMGAVADAALAGGGAVVGIIPHALVSREIAHRGLTELIEVGSMHERKAEMERRSDAFIVLPGGLGTLDELCEIVTWALLGIHSKPVVLVNTNNYWDGFLKLLDHAVHCGFLRSTHRELLAIASDAQGACALVERVWNERNTRVLSNTATS